MSAISHEQYARIERNLRYVTDQVRPLCNREMQDDIRTAQYVLSVVRQYAASYEMEMTQEERNLLGLDLMRAFYK